MLIDLPASSILWARGEAYSQKDNKRKYSMGRKKMEAEDQCFLVSMHRQRIGVQEEKSGRDLDDHYIMLSLALKPQPGYVGGGEYSIEMFKGLN